MKRTLSLLPRALGAAALLAGSVSFGAPVRPDEIKVEQELIIRATGVVDSKEALNAPDGGRFTIEHLLAGLSRDGTAKTGLIDWLSVWTNAAGRQIGRELLDQWKARDGAAALTDAAWQPNFTHAPFRLLAITNRLDLQRRDADGLPLSAGEGRFVFCFTDGSGPGAAPLPATVIFEYELPARTEAEVLGWALAWHALGQFSAIDQSYADALADLTERFTRRGAAPGKPNGSALNQIRTNEIAFSNPWNLREFRLRPGVGDLLVATTKQTPRDDLFTSPLVADYINAHEADILAQSHRVPRLVGGQPFLATQSGVPNAQAALWNPPGVRNPAARYLFAFNTCNGCHGGEAQTTAFTHISPRAAGQPAALSAFLSDLPPRDPVRQVAHPELQEITARRKIMALVLSGTPPAFSLFSSRALVRQVPPPPAELLQLLSSRVNREH